MGIFSGGFGSGLATGLATSVSKSLTDAMDRREEELSKARVFWQTRQAQKQDQVDAENKRIEKAYKRMTSEMGGDTAKGLAAYQAVGGTIDDVERYIDVLNKTQEANMDYSLQDKLDFDGLSLGDYGDFTFDKGFDSIKSVVTAADVNYVEAPSILTAIGLGQDTDRVGKSLQQQVDQLIPRSERTDAGIGAAKVKGRLYAGTMSAEEAIRNQDKKSMNEIIASKYEQMGRLKRGSPEYNVVETELNEAIAILKSIEQPTGFTASTSTYQRGLSNALDNAIKNSTSASGALLDAEGTPITDDEKIKARKKELEVIAYTPYMDNLFNEDGTYRNEKARIAVELSGDPSLQSIAAQEQERRSGVAPTGGREVLTEEQKAAEKAAADALTVRNTLDDSSAVTKLMAPIIKDGKITTEDETKFINAIINNGKAGLNEEDLAAYTEQVRSTYGPLFKEAREKAELGKTPEGRLTVLQDTITNFALSDEASTETIEAIKEANDKAYLAYAGIGAGIPAKERDRMEADVIEDKAEETLKQILKDDGYDPILIKRNSRPYYDELLGNLTTKYNQAVKDQRTKAEEAEKDRQRLNTLG